MQVVRPLLGAVSSGMESGGLWSSLKGLFGFNHGGGMVGNPTFQREVSPAVFAGAPRFHAGGWPGLTSDEVPIIDPKGERVLSRPK